MQNKDIAGILVEIADLLEIKGEDTFRVNSYRNAARTISSLQEDIADIAGSSGELVKLPGIGKSMAEKIREIVRKGRLSQLDELRRELPPSLLEILKLEQMGPKRTRTLYKQLNIRSVEDLEKAVENGKVQKLEGFGEKFATQILREIEEYHRKGGYKRFKISEAADLIRPLVDYLSKEVKDIEVAGSYRRGKETVGDIDILGISRDAGKAMEFFVNYPETSRVISRGKAKTSVMLHAGIQVDFRVFEKDSYGAALLFFTGSQAHNVALRRICQEKGFKLNEYGIYRGEERVAGTSETEMYKKMGLPFIAPEMREDTGELDAAKEGKLPELIELKDIKGDLQSHTRASDGKNSLKEMAEAARGKGYEYFAVTDHSKKVSVAGGLDEKRLARQMEEIESLNEKLEGFRVLKSVEVDILRDGTLDLDHGILREMDLVVCAIHFDRKLSKKEQTLRVLRAMENPFCNILAHPTGRLIGKRREYEIDLKEIMKEAAAGNWFLEINSDPERLDLNDVYIRQAKEAGVKMVISTDAHSVVGLDNIKYGLMQARRGWLEKDDVVNTRSWKEFRELIKR